MRREEILEKLSRLSFCAFWPGDWDDIGFTERQIWFNSQGYGYYACDEPCAFLDLEHCSDAFIASIKNKVRNETLCKADIQGTPLEDLAGYFGGLDDFLIDRQEDLLELPDHWNDKLYCGLTDEGWSYFQSEEELIHAFERDDSDYYFGEYWSDLSDDLLSCWYSRIFEEELDMCLGKIPKV